MAIRLLPDVAGVVSRTAASAYVRARMDGYAGNRRAERARRAYRARAGRLRYRCSRHPPQRRRQCCAG